MDLEIIILSEVIQTEKKQIYDTTYTWDLKKKNSTNEFTRQKQTHRQINGYQWEQTGEG